MKYTALFLCILLFFLQSLNSLTQVKQLARGVSYYHKQTDQPFPLSFHIVRINPAFARIELRASHNTCAGAQRTSEMAVYTNAIVAINGSFFDFGQSSKWQDTALKVLDCLGMAFYHAYPIWAMKIKSDWYSLSDTSAGLIAWNDGGNEAIITSADTTALVHIGSNTFPVTDLNKPFSKGPILYTAVYGRKTTAGSDRVELIIKDNRVIDRIYGGNVAIGKDMIIYSCSLDQAKELGITTVDNASIASVDICIKSPTKSLQEKQWEYIRASTPLLLQNGEIETSLYTMEGWFYSVRHPRTALGLTNSGQWFFIVVDGRQSHSKGLTLLELAELMKMLHCTSALNLDGGGSSTIVINNSVVNQPAGREHALIKKERPISDAFIVIPRD